MPQAWEEKPHTQRQGWTAEVALMAFLAFPQEVQAASPKLLKQKPDGLSARGL